MIELRGQLICGDEAELALVQALLPDHVALTRAEPGCLLFEVTQSADPMVWNVFEQFIDRAAFDAHQIRGKASVWGQRTGALRRDFTITDRP